MPSLSAPCDHLASRSLLAVGKGVRVRVKLSSGSFFLSVRVSGEIGRKMIERTKSNEELVVHPAVDLHICSRERVQSGGGVERLWLLHDVLAVAMPCQVQVQVQHLCKEPCRAASSLLRAWRAVSPTPSSCTLKTVKNDWRDDLLQHDAKAGANAGTLPRAESSPTRTSTESGRWCLSQVSCGSGDLPGRRAWRSKTWAQVLAAIFGRTRLDAQSGTMSGWIRQSKEDI